MVNDLFGDYRKLDGNARPGFQRLGRFLLYLERSEQ